MTNFTVKNHFKAENAKLVDATTVYQVENGTWYMELQYEYEDESGVHRRYYPKVEFPFFYIVHDVCVIDNLVKPAVHNMTIEEIEKELGYKINIINKENSND